MKKIVTIKNLISLIIIFLISSYFLVNSSSINVAFLNNEQKEQIKKYFLPYTYISQQEETISRLEETFYDQNKAKDQNLFRYLAQLELSKVEAGDDIQIKKITVELMNNLTLNKYQLLSGFYFGINNQYPGSGYIDFYEDNLVILSSRGVLAYKKNISNENESFKQIGNNIDDFISVKQYEKNNWFSLKDLLIFNDKVFISFTEEIEDDCWNTSIIYGIMNYDDIAFTKLFSSTECVHTVNNLDGEFNAHQSGGRIISFDKDHILLSIGDYRSRYLAQDEQSINGKIIKINILNSNYEIISIGHRNPQGLYFDEINNFILETEHGPKGGDEINIIDVNKIKKGEFQNFGWPISSAGEHYGGKSLENNKKYEKYPLHNSHAEYGFIEPIKSFVPSIGISEIVKIGQNKYIVSSLRDQSIYFFELDNQNIIVNFERIEVFERIRDLKFLNDQLYLFLEDTASIGVINLESLKY
tara:strand:+ start:672 stop:2084 length:1413 start_codon:yes stop_codon:yes gene_type:complete